MPRNRDLDDYDEDDEDDDEPRQQLEGDALVRHLRRELKAQKKALTEATGKLSEYAKRDRRESVESVLKAADVDTRYARWVVRDLDDAEPTKEAVEKWLDENAELVGAKRAESSVDEETQNSMRRIQSADRGGKSGVEADPIAAKLTDPNLTPAEWEALTGKSLTG